jgi:hypothetical protein
MEIGSLRMLLYLLKSSLMIQILYIGVCFGLSSIDESFKTYSFSSKQISNLYKAFMLYTFWSS